MNKLKSLCLAFTFCIVFAPGIQADNHQTQAFAKHVLIIGVDGMSPDGIANAKTPAMDALITGGAYTPKARAVMPTSSGPNWASMVMGAGPEQHGVTSNDWRRDNFELPATTLTEENIFPTIYGVLRAEQPDATIGCIYDWDGIEHLVEKKPIDALVNGDGPDDTTTKAIEFIKLNSPDLTFIHLDHVDITGHQHGYHTDQYYDSVEHADKLIGQIVTALKDSYQMENTLIIISSDHGGVGKGHGGATKAEVEIPLILHGPKVKPGYTIEAPVNVYDIAATTAYALGLEMPEAWIARPVKSAFKQ